MFLNSINPKWNPLMDGQDLCTELALIDEELELNTRLLKQINQWSLTHVGNFEILT
jgi:hypothetical protein